MLEDRGDFGGVDNDSEEMIGVVEEANELIESEFALGTVHNTSLFMSSLEGELAAMSFEQEVSLG